MFDVKLIERVANLEDRLEKLKPPPKPKHWFDAMLIEIADVVSMSTGDIIGECKEQEAVGARCGIAAALYDAGWSKTGISRLLGRDHTSIVSILRSKVRDQYFRRPYVRICYDIARRHVPGATQTESNESGVGHTGAHPAESTRQNAVAATS